MRISAKRRRLWGICGDFECDTENPSLCIRGGQTEVVRFGRGEPIVMLPGLAGGWRLVAPLARRLARSHEVFLIGLRGDRGQFLASESLQRAEDHAHDIAERIGQLRLERPLLFGVSYGGAIALELATDYPALVGGLILYGTGASFPFGLAATLALQVLERYPLPNDNPFVNQFFNLLHGRQPEPSPLVEFIVRTCWESDQAVMAARLRSLQEYDVSDRLWRIDVPTLVLAGTKDVIVPPARQRDLADSIGEAHFETIEGAGHIGFLTHAAEVDRHVRRHVRVLAQAAF